MVNSAQTSLGTLYPELASAQTTSNTNARAATLGDLQTLGSGYSSAMTSASPLLGAAQNKLTGMVDTADQQSDLAKSLNSQALTNLNLGSSLSDGQVRDSTQATRAGLASRGMVNGNNAIGAEILNRDSYGQQLQTTRQNQALSVENLNNTEKTAGQNFVLNANNAGQTLANSSLGMLTGTTGLDVNSLTNFASPSAALSATTSGANSLLGYQADVSSSNFNAQTDAQRSQANNNAALMGSTIGAYGSLGAAYLKNH
jgi:hypothetical protein